VFRVADQTDYERPVSSGNPAPGTLARFVFAARAVADADPAKTESAARQFGESRRYLAPVAWTAGALVLLVRGVKLLFLNWRLTLIEFVPAAWLWLVMWDLEQHALRHAAFRELTVAGTITLFVLAIAISIASFWCNTVFGFAISASRPRIATAARQARPYRLPILAAGLVLGAALGSPSANRAAPALSTDDRRKRAGDRVLMRWTVAIPTLVVIAPETAPSRLLARFACGTGDT
jgi:hypothetical protein